MRDSLKDSILYAYYACYAIILFFAFLLIPSNFFYHGLDPGLEEDEVEPTVGQRLCYSLRYSLLSVFLFSLLVTAGIFIPFEGTPPSNSSEWEKFEWFFDELESNQGKDLLLFLLNTLNMIGKHPRQGATWSDSLFTICLLFRPWTSHCLHWVRCVIPALWDDPAH